MYALLFVAVVNQTPAVMGHYQTQDQCQRAIRSIYETRAVPVVPPGVVISQQQQELIQRSIDLKVQYQREYRCLPVDAD